MKSFKTLDEQIFILRSRELVIDDETNAKNYLLSNNYYNIINGYGKYFPRDGDKYTNGTTFEEVSRLYLLDKELKQAFFEAIIDAEAHLKAIFAYRFAEAFPDKPYAYLNVDCYDENKRLSVVSTMAHLAGTINRQQRFSGNSINHYVGRHNDVPIWVLIGHIDFGNFRHMLSACTTSVQNNVARDLRGFISQNVRRSNKFTSEIMLSFVENINDLRNVCAHNNRLFGYECRRDSKYWLPLHGNYSITPNEKRRSVFSVFLSLQCFLSKAEYAKLHNTVMKRMKNHLRHIVSLPPDRVLDSLGFPHNWHISTSKLKQ